MPRYNLRTLLAVIGVVALYLGLVRSPVVASRVVPVVTFIAALVYGLKMKASSASILWIAFFFSFVTGLVIAIANLGSSVRAHSDLHGKFEMAASDWLLCIVVPVVAMFFAAVGGTISGWLLSSVVRGWETK